MFYYMWTSSVKQNFVALLFWRLQWSNHTKVTRIQSQITNMIHWLLFQNTSYRRTRMRRDLLVVRVTWRLGWITHRSTQKIAARSVSALLDQHSLGHILMKEIPMLGTGRLCLTTFLLLLEDEKRKFVHLFLCAAKLVCSLELMCTDLHDRAGMAARVHTDLRPC